MHIILGTPCDLNYLFVLMDLKITDFEWVSSIPLHGGGGAGEIWFAEFLFFFLYF